MMRSWRSGCAGGGAVPPLSGVTKNSGCCDACEGFGCFRNERRSRFGGRRCPAKNLQIAPGIFSERGAAFNPVAVVEVDDAVDMADRRVMNMTAPHRADAS